MRRAKQDFLRAFNVNFEEVNLRNVGRLYKIRETRTPTQHTLTEPKAFSNRLVDTVTLRVFGPKELDCPLSLHNCKIMPMNTRASRDLIDKRRNCFDGVAYDTKPFCDQARKFADVGAEVHDDRIALSARV